MCIRNKAIYCDYYIIDISSLDYRKGVIFDGAQVIKNELPQTFDNFGLCPMCSSLF